MLRLLPLNISFFKLLNWFLTFTISSNKFVTCLLFNPTSFANSLKLLMALLLKPLKNNLWFLPDPTTTSSLEVSNSSNLPTILLTAGFFVDIPASLTTLANDWSMSLITSLAVTCPAATLPLDAWMDSNNSLDFLPSGTKGSLIYLLIHLSKALLLFARALPWDANLPAI